MRSYLVSRMNAEISGQFSDNYDDVVRVISLWGQTELKPTFSCYFDRRLSFVSMPLFPLHKKCGGKEG